MPNRKRISANARMAVLESSIKKLKIIAGLFFLIIVAFAIYFFNMQAINIFINGQPVGQRLTGIDAPLSSSELSIVNNASNNNFEKAGEMLLNLSLPGEALNNGTYTGVVFFQKQQKYTPYTVNGKPSVIYIGAISCIFCGENRWAMALALSRFGTFNSLYKGYSSLQDGDVPTLYWSVMNYTTKAHANFANYYKSNYINFISVEYESPITSGFQFPSQSDPIQYFVNATQNQTDKNAMIFMDNLHLFTGTPFTFWGASPNTGADAVVFGTFANNSQQSLPALSYMKHNDILNQIKNFNNSFGYEQYAAADVYIAETCPAIGNAAPICSMPSIKTLESKMGLS